MSKPAPGNYIIYNRVLGHTGQKLAITFTGQDKPATVTPLSYTNEQIVSPVSLNALLFQSY